MSASSYQRGLDGKSSPRDVIDTAFGPLTTPEKDRQDFEQGKMDRSRIEAEEKAREKQKP